MSAPYDPLRVIPRVLGEALDPLPYWFVIGGQAVRCFAPYRPSRDIDFGIDSPANLDDLVGHVEGRRLDVTGVLATKLHAILDRGLRRDFFDLYVMLQQHQLGIVAVLSAIRAVYPGQIDDGLMLRALTYFDDADREPSLPGEGPSDWRVVKDYFLVQVGRLLTPPVKRLKIRAQTIDLDEP